MIKKTNLKGNPKLRDPIIKAYSVSLSHFKIYLYLFTSRKLVRLLVVYTRQTSARNDVAMVGEKIIVNISFDEEGRYYCRKEFLIRIAGFYEKKWNSIIIHYTY